MMVQVPFVPNGKYWIQRNLSPLFGVTLLGDVVEKCCGAGVRPPLGRARTSRLELIRKAGVLFIHIPKNAGMSVSAALYGAQITHSTLRYYQTVAPHLCGALPSFAVLRDPTDRFLSGYTYATSGGSAHNTVSPHFRDRYRGFRSVDDALDHVEGAKNWYAVDHIFRPQTWYITTSKGNVGVKHLFLLDQVSEVSSFLTDLNVSTLPHLNASRRQKLRLSADQAKRLRRIYHADVDLVDSVRQRGFPPALSP